MNAPRDYRHADDCSRMYDPNQPCTCGADPRVPVRHRDMRPRRVRDSERTWDKEQRAGEEYWRKT
jgi:hypothetical protein